MFLQSKLWVQLSKYQQLTGTCRIFQSIQGLTTTKSNWLTFSYDDESLVGAMKLEEWKLIIIVGTRNMKGIRQQLEKQRDIQETTEDKNPVAPLTESHRRENIQSGSQNSYHMVISHQSSEELASRVHPMQSNSLFKALFLIWSERYYFSRGLKIFSWSV